MCLLWAQIFFDVPTRQSLRLTLRAICATQLMVLNLIEAVKASFVLKEGVLPRRR